MSFSFLQVIWMKSMHLSKLPSARYETNQFVQHNLNFLLFLPTVLSQTYYPLCNLK